VAEVVEGTQNNDGLQAGAHSKARLTEVICDGEIHDSDISTIQNQSSSAKNTSSSSNDVSATPNVHDIIKNVPSMSCLPLLPVNYRYRTVVPARVFMNDPSEYPELYDSFHSAPLPRLTPLVSSDSVNNRSCQSEPFPTHS